MSTDPTPEPAPAGDRMFALIASIPGSGSADWCGRARALLDEVRAEAVAAAVPVVVPPADRAALRERIAAAIWERQNPGRRWADCEYRWRADAEEDADAVLAVLPASVPAAVYRGLADEAAEWGGVITEQELRRKARQAETGEVLAATNQGTLDVAGMTARIATKKAEPSFQEMAKVLQQPVGIGFVQAQVLREAAEECDKAGGVYAARGADGAAGAAFALMETFLRKANEAEYVATPCDSMSPCEDGGEPCHVHERLMAHGEGEHELCEPDCGTREALPAVEAALDSRTNLKADSKPACRTTQHCAYHGWCHRCAPEFATVMSAVNKALRVDDVESHWGPLYEAIGRTLREVLPASDRATTLRWAADQIDAETAQLKADGVLEPEKFRPCRDASAQLRRLAGEAEQDEPLPRCTCGETACESELCDCDSTPCPVDHTARAARQDPTPDSEPEPDDPTECSGEEGFCPEHGFHRHSLKQNPAAPSGQPDTNTEA